MKTFILSAVALLFTLNSANSQSILAGKKALNLSISSIYEDPMASKFKERKIRFRPGLGISFINSNLFVHELSIREFWIKHQSYRNDNFGPWSPSGNEEQFNFTSSVRYGFGKYFKTKKEHLFYKLSAGVIGQVNYQEIRPNVSTEYSTVEQNNSVFMELVPEINLVTKGNRLINIGLPLRLLDFTNATNTVHNPSVSFDDQKNSVNELNWLPAIFELRVSYSFLK